MAKIVNSENDSICLVCNVKCNSSEQLQEHKKGNQFVCRVCTNVFDNHRVLETHFMSHNKYKCKLCDAVFLTKYDCLQHKNSGEKCSNRKKHQCERCGKVYIRSEALQQHIKHSHSDNAINYSCEVCGKLFKHISSVETHKKSLHLAYEYMECQFCHKLLEGPERLKIHTQRAHVENLEDTEIFCTICGKCFGSRQLLQFHYRWHDNTEYKCDVCGKSFNGKIRFDRHVNHQHKEGTFTCIHCHKVFPTEGKLHVHRKIHYRKKVGPFFCEICGRPFKTRAILKSHQEIHSEARPYQCDVCGATFKQRVALLTHGRVHSDVTKYHCDSCGLGFKWKQTLESHIPKCVKDN